MWELEDLDRSRKNLKNHVLRLWMGLKKTEKNPELEALDGSRKT